MPTKKTRKSKQTPMAKRPAQYLVARRDAASLPANVEPMSLSLLQERLSGDGEIEVLEQMQPTDGDPTFLCMMSDDRADALKQSFGSALIIEKDEDLEMMDEIPVIDRLSAVDPGLVLLDEQEVTTVSIVVKSRTSPPKAVAGATVYLIGQLWPIKGVTDARGRVRLELLGETPDSIAGLYVKPAEGYWSFWMDDPQLSPDDDNLISLAGFETSHPGFPSAEAVTWGHQATGLDVIRPGLTGAGVKIGVIDSGMATSHPDLDAAGGFDFTESDDPDETWRTDTVRHGSHVSGTIAASGNGQGIRGFAPDAEIHVFKVFPGGKFSDLIKALEKCIALKLDVVNLSLGSKKTSEILAQKFQAAADKGVACIAAAGNSGDAVGFPAQLPTVLTVAAIGQHGKFPDDSYHQRQVGQHASEDGRFFSARFTCFGPEVDVCAPGVAVLSTVPDTGYAALDGTSMACPHVVGLAALLLQHRNDIADMPRNAQRVQALFSALKSGATDLNMPAEYQGAGMPTAQQLGIAVPGSTPVSTPARSTDLEQLIADALTLARKRLAEMT